MFNLILPHFLQPIDRTLPQLNTPALNQLLRLARFTPHERTTSQLYHAVFALPKLPEHGALAVPIWQQMGMNTTQLLDSRLLSISEAEAMRWIAALNEFYAGDVAFSALQPRIWQIHVPHMQKWHIPSVLDIGGQTDGMLRSELGANGQWLQLNTELQMWLHDHPLNQERQARGELPINGLWLWQPEMHETRFQAALIGSDSIYAVFHNDKHTDFPYDFAAWQRGCDELNIALNDSLLLSEAFVPSALSDDVWGYQHELHEWENRFFAPMLTALQQGQLPEFNLICEQGSLHISAARRWQFWRKAVPFDGKHLG